MSMIKTWASSSCHTPSPVIHAPLIQFGICSTGTRFKARTYSRLATIRNEVAFLALPECRIKTVRARRTRAA